MDKRTCIFASTKYQIMNAVHLVITRELVADLYLIDEGIYTDCHTIIENIRRKKIFQNVILVKTTDILNYSMHKSLNSFLCYINYRKIVPLYLLPYLYNTMLFCTNSIIERLTRFYLIETYDYSPKFIMFDEGVGSYFGNMEQIHTRGDKFLRKVIFKKKENSNHIFDKFLYVPELYVHNEDSAYGNIMKIPPINLDTELDVFNDIFEFQEKYKIDEKVIFIDLPSDRVFNENGKKKYYNIIEKLETFWKSELVMKKHPSDKKKKHLNIKYCECSDIPFEIIIGNSDVNNKILISVFSTATITPKILFNQEPKVILLCKIFQGYSKECNEKVIKFFEKVNELYHAEKYYIPETENELFEILDKLKVERK